MKTPPSAFSTNVFLASLRRAKLPVPSQFCIVQSCRKRTLDVRCPAFIPFIVRHGVQVTEVAETCPSLRAVSLAIAGGCFFWHSVQLSAAHLQTVHWGLTAFPMMISRPPNALIVSFTQLAQSAELPPSYTISSSSASPFPLKLTRLTLVTRFVTHALDHNRFYTILLFQFLGQLVRGFFAAKIIYL